ncbi:MAG: hypothetical protein ACKOCB_06070 [Planctomycetia bacterium]
MPEIRVSVRIGAFDLHYEGSQAFFERVVDPLIARVVPYPPAVSPQASLATQGSLASSVGPTRAAEAPAAEPSGPGSSPEFRAFVKRLGPEAAAPDRQVLAVAFYLWQYEKRDEVSVEDIAACFRSIGLPPPESVRDLLEDLSERLRFMAPGPHEGAWTISTKGVNYVKTRLMAND